MRGVIDASARGLAVRAKSCRDRFSILVADGQHVARQLALICILFVWRVPRVIVTVRSNQAQVALGLHRIRRPTAPAVCMIAEPGIIGKIGMNSAGLGTCLNLLRIGPLDVGVPVHIVLRAVLDSRSIDDACNEVRRAGNGKASNILVGDANGQCLDVEFAGKRQDLYDSFADVVTHTNHFLVKSGCDEPQIDLNSSFCRYEVACKHGESLTSFGVTEMTAILSDQSVSDFPILRNYERHDLVGKIGTVCTLVMELAAGRIHVRMGNDPTGKMSSYEVG